MAETKGRSIKAKLPGEFIEAADALRVTPERLVVHLAEAFVAMVDPEDPKISLPLRIREL